MKKQIMNFALVTEIISKSYGEAFEGTIPSNNSINTLLPNISLVEVQERLLTQNSITNPLGTQRTGSFATNSRWNSMRNLIAPSQTLNGFRTQTDGRAITINGNTLQAGIYLYSLISNGQEIITKRMVITK